MSEKLKELLGDDELYSKVMDKAGDTKIYVHDGSFVPKKRIDEITAQKKQQEELANDLQSQLDDVSTKLSEFSKKAETVDAYKAEVDTLKQSLADNKAESATKIAALAKDYKVKSAIKALNPKNEKAVTALFDLDSVSVDGDNLIGFNEQAEVIKKENDFLFGDAPKDEIPGAPPKPKGTDPSVNPFLKGSVNLLQQVELKRTNPEAFDRMKAEAAIKNAQG